MTFRTTAIMLLLAAGASVSGVALADEGAATAKITGTVFYREKIALPDDAVLRIRLEVAAAPEMPARLVAQITVPTEGKQVPIAFELPYTAADIQSQKRYQVRVSVTSGTQTLWASRVPYPVITKGAPTKVEIELQQAGAGRRVRPQAVAAVGSLAGTSWKLVALGETPAVTPPDGAPASLAFEPAQRKIAGSTGCNRFMGSYTAGDGTAVKIDPNGMTLMACADAAMRQETAFLAALRAATSYRLGGGKLELLDDDRVVARFEADAGAPARNH